MQAGSVSVASQRPSALDSVLSISGQESPVYYIENSVMAALRVVRLVMAIYSIQVFASTKSVKVDLESGEIALGKPIIATSTCGAFETYCYMRGKGICR